MGLVLQLVVTATGLILAPLAYLAVLTGLCLRSPHLIAFLTVGLLGDYGLCTFLHAYYIPLVSAGVGLVHVAASLALLSARLRAAKAPRTLIGAVNAALYVTLILGGHAVFLVVLVLLGGI